MRFIPSILRSFPFNVMLYFVGFLSPPLPAAAASYDRIQTLSMDEGLPHSDVNAITQDRDGYLWFATFSGLSKYDGYRLQTFRTDNSDLTSDRILCLFVARDSSLYIGTESGGLNRYDPVSETIFPVAEEPTTSADQVINNIFEDRKGTVWVCRNDGLGYLTLRGATTYLHVKNRWRGFYIQCGTALDSCRLLLSTDAGPVIYNPETEEIQNILRDEIKTRCFSMQSFADGKIALSGGWGVRIYDPKTDDLQRICDFSSRVTTQDNHGNIWVGSFNRGLYKYDRNGIKIVHYHPKLPIPHAVNSFEISALFEDRSGVLWIGTIGEGLFLMTEGRCGGKTPRFSCFDTSNSRFFNNELESLQEDDHGAFWIGGYGITRFDPRDHSIRHFTVKDQLQSNSFKIWASYRLRNGEMVFGGVKGFNIFHPDSITDNDIRPRTAISRLKIRNQTVSAGDSVCGRVVLPRAINRLNKLDLSYNCNNLTFEFSAFAYVDPKYNTYKYRMENFDTDWNYTSGLSPQAVYTNLRPGSYRLVVYASNEDGYWSQAPAVLEITIRPPVYATRLAWLCYIALTILFLYRWHRRSLRKLQERHQIELERNKYYEEQKSSANMLQFYTDIAHELKTPLSLITAPVEELLLNPHIGKTTRNRLELVNRNAGALKTLLEQILDLRKYESHKMELAAVQTDASEFLRGIAELFKPLADQLQIQFSQEIPNDPLILWIDRRKMEIVIANLLYNAFKYSRKSSGKVNLVCEEQQLSVTISVEDNGIGIARDEQSRIFERFYQARNNNSPQKSIGIGLSLVKHIVTLHHGEIEVASELNVGSLFRVRIPKGCAHLAPEQIKDSDKVPGRPFQNLPIGMDSALSDFGDDQFESEMAAETAIGNDRGMQCGLLEENTRHGAAASDGKRVSILVAEDNTALRDYLRSALENRYNVSTARNGEEAYCQAINEQPDLVLTDIVMPGMSGIELCRKIKENSRTSAIGVILLTAHNLQNYEVSGYRVGADAYVAKPFSLEVLFSRIDNLVARQNKIHKNSQPIKEIPISEVAVEKSEDRFLVKCTETIETEIADPRFDVLQLCRKIGVSRSQLYRRILALTGLTPIQFIRSIRLKHAASFLAQDGTLPVNEVMYRVGYTNLSHFAKIFHEEFGLYPKEFALRNRSKTGKVDSASEIFSKNEPETQK